MKLFLAQINPTVGDIPNNLDLILDAIDEAKSVNADLIAFPELALSGAPLNDLLFHHSFVEECETALQRIAMASLGLTVIVGTPATDGNSVFDAAVIFHNGKEIGRQHDVCWCWDAGGKKVGVVIGEGNPETLAGQADLIVHLAASPWTPGAIEARRHSVKGRILSLHVPYLFVNLVGGNDGWIFDGNSFLCASDGTITFEAAGFAETVAEVTEEKILLPLPSPIEQIHTALLLGISDYFRKQNIADAVVGLSGGIDSSVTATLLTQALGPSHVKAVMLPSQFTSEESVDGAKEVAHNLGIAVRTIPIDSVVEAAAAALSLGGVAIEGMAAENLQSRVRSLLLMAMTNAEASMLVGTTNKSELALGYTTLYGDLCGALLPLGDLFKTEVYALCAHLNAQKVVIPLSITERAPTAELRLNQKDTDDLPAYDLLDPVLRHLVLEGLSPLETTAKTGMNLKLVQKLAEKVFALEFKRRQGPCILRVSTKAFGIDVVYPIVNRYTQTS